MSLPIAVIAGLGNPGSQYERTRHNAGFWYLDELARRYHATFRHERKYQGDICRIALGTDEVWLLKPQNFMNRSGESVAALLHYLKLPTAQLLVAHDELDLPAGQIRLKQSGGHGGHNGLRNLFSHLPDKDFYRLRIGIDHPGEARLVTNYVLGRASSDDQQQIEQAIIEASDLTPQIVSGDHARVMNRLHSSH